MNQVSTFRGLAGEVVAGFCHPATFLTAVPILVIWLLIGAAIGFTPLKQAPILCMAIIFIVSTLMIGRFAMPAARGEVHVGFFSVARERGEILGFLLRYLVVTATWAVPLGIVAWLLLRNQLGGLMGLGLGMDPGALARHGLVGVLTIVMTVVFLLAPTLGCLIATAGDEMSDVIGISPWRELIFDRSADTVTFYAALFGGLTVFGFIYLIPAMLLIALLMQMSPGAGLVASGLIMLWPVAMSPILLGRLCGAFVAGDGVVDPESRRSEMDLLASGDASVATAAAEALARRAAGEASGASAPLHAIPPASSAVDAPPVPMPSPDQPLLNIKPTVEKIARKVEQTADGDLEAAMQRAEEYYNSHPKDAHAAVELALYYRRAGRLAEALTLAATAITTLLDTGAGAMAGKVFRSFEADRFKIKLDAQRLTQFGQMLIKLKHFFDAGWCLYRALRASGGDIELAQRKLMEIADAASKAGQAADATSLYRLLVKHHPDSEAAALARAALEKSGG